MTIEITLPDSGKVSEPKIESQQVEPVAQPAASVPIEVTLPDQPSELHEKYWGAIKENPDRAAEIMKLSKAFDQEPAFVASNLDSAKQAAEAPTEEYWKQYEKMSPLTAEFLKKQYNMAAAKDEYDKLPFYESWARQTVDGIQKNYYETRLNWLAAKQMEETKKFGIPSLTGEQNIQDYELKLKPLNETDASVGKNFHPLYQAASQAINLGVGMGAGLAGSALGGLAKIPPSAGGAISAAGASGYLSYVVEAGGAYREYIGTKDKNGQPVDPVKAAEMAQKVGYVNAALEAAGEAVLFTKILKPIGKAAGSVIAEPVMKVLSKVPGAEKLIAKITASPEIFAGMTVKQAIKQAGKDLLISLGSEMGTEYAQEVVTSVGGELAKKQTGPDFEMKSAGDIAKDASGVLYPTFQSTLLLGLMGGGSHVYNESRAMSQALHEKEAVKALGEGSKDIKLRARLPEAHKELVSSVTVGTPVEHILVPAEAIQTYFQGQNLDATAAMRELGVEKQFVEAVQTGGDVKIPTAVWADKIVGTPHAKGLENDVKLSEDGMTFRQAEERKAEMQTLMQQQVAKAQESVKENETVRAGYDLVFNDIKAKLEAVGKPEGMTSKLHSNQIDKAATLWASHAVAEAARRGITVEEFYRGTNNPDIQPGGATVDMGDQAAAQYQPAILQRIQSEIEAGDHESGGIVPQANADMLQAGVETQKFIPSSSTFPEYFKSKGFTKKETLTAIKKQLDGKELTDRQQTIIEDLYRASGYDTRTKVEPFLQSRVMAPAFYSKLERMIEEKVSNNATPQQILATLREVKPEEIQYSGINKFLEGKTKVSKQDLLDFIKENQIEFKEVNKGASSYISQDAAELLSRDGKRVWHKDSDGTMSTSLSPEQVLALPRDAVFITEEVIPGETKFEKYTLPGGENYREVLFTLSQKTTEDQKKTPAKLAKEMFGKDSFYDLTPEQQNQIVEKNVVDPKQEYKSGHWEERNVLAHVRLNDRVDSEGKKVLFVEEIQSDWHQDGRKKGYRSEQDARFNELIAKRDEAKERRAKIVQEAEAKGMSYIEAVAQDAAIQADTIAIEAQKEINVMGRTEIGVPDAPFKKTWHELMLKRILREAVEKGYDRVAWTTGEQQAERYALDKHINQASASKVRDGQYYVYLEGKDGRALFEGDNGFSENGNKQMTPAEMESMLGKDLSKRLIEGADVKVKDEKNPWFDVKGENLKIGGEGMKGFYDKIIPDFLNKYTKKWGGKVSKAEVESKQGAISEKRIYQGPTATVEQLRKAAKGADSRIQNQLWEAAHILEQHPDRPFVEIATNSLSLASAEAIGGTLVKDPSQKDTATVHSLDITPQMKDSILHEGQTLFQAMNGDPRGSVSFLSDKAVISLFKKADASTFIHESAHVWLKDMHDFVQSGKASEAYMRDFNTLSDWLGIKVDQTTLTVEQQEKFARGFEAYLREGKAPSESLKGVFASFRRWLTKIYKDVSLLNVELSPAVRGVMDRMISSETEISHAEQSQGVSSQPMDGLSPTLNAEIQAAQDRAHEESVSELMALQMKELEKEHAEKMTRLREESTKVATESADKEPVYKASARITEELKLEPKEAAKQYITGLLSEAHAAIFDLLAEENGYSSGDEMAKNISGSPTRAETIAGKVEWGMMAHDDMRNTQQIKDEAIRIIHNDKQLEMFALEKAAIESMGDKNQDTPEAKARRAGKARADYAFIKAQAREILSQRKIKDAGAFLSFFTAERNAATQVTRALLKKDYETAASFKEKQMLNHALAMEALRIKRQADRWVDYLHKTQIKRVDLFKAQDHFAQVAAILDRFGFPRKDFNRELKTESLAQWSERIKEITDNVVIPDWILDESNRASYQELTMDQLQDVVNTLKNIQSAANWEKKAMTILGGMNIDDIILKIDDQLNKLVADKDKHKFNMEPEKFESLVRGLKGYKMSLTKMDTLMRSADGWKDFGLLHSIFIEPVYQAANVESKMMFTANEGIAKAWEPYSKKERAEMSEKRIYYPELGTSATKMRLIAMALNLGNADNRARLFGTPPIGVNKDVEWSQQVVMKLLEKHLTEKDWVFVQNIWDNLNTLWPSIAALSKEIAGFTPAKVEAQPFTVKSSDGKILNLPGGYYPLKEDSRASDKASLREQLDQPLYNEKNPAWVAATKTGHTKARAKEVTYAVDLNITRINRHIRDVIHDVAFRKVITDLRRITGDELFRQSIVSNIGPEAHTAIKEWVSSVASGNVADKQMVNDLERAALWMRSHTTQAVLALKTGVITQNLANPLLFAGAIENFGHAEAARAWTVRGIGDYIPKLLYNRKAAKEIQEFVFEKSPFMRDKTETPDFSFHETKNLMFGHNSDLSQFAAGLMSGSDNLTNIPMWLEAYHNELERSKDEYKAVRYADTLIARTTGSSRKYDQAAIQRGGVVEKMVAMFYSFVNTELQRWMAESGRAAEPGIKNKARFAGFVASRLLLFQGLSLLLSDKHPGDGEDPVKWWIAEMAAYPMGFFPGAREIGGVFMDQALGLKSFGYRPSPALSVIDSAIILGSTAKKALSGEGKAQDLAEASAKMASFVFPFPDQINQWAFNALDWANGMEPKTEDLYRRRAKKER